MTDRTPTPETPSRIADQINAAGILDNFSKKIVASPWENHGLRRVYLRTTSRKQRPMGFVAIHPDDTWDTNNIKGSTLAGHIETSLENV